MALQYRYNLPAGGGRSPTSSNPLLSIGCAVGGKNWEDGVISILICWHHFWYTQKWHQCPSTDSIMALVSPPNLPVVNFLPLWLLKSFPLHLLFRVNNPLPIILTTEFRQIPENSLDVRLCLPVFCWTWCRAYMPVPVPEILQEDPHFPPRRLPILAFLQSFQYPCKPCLGKMGKNQGLALMWPQHPSCFVRESVGDESIIWNCSNSQSHVFLAGIMQI